MKNYQNFDGAFSAYWQLLMKRHQADENISYYTITKDERRQLESINEKSLRLREVTDKGTRVTKRAKPLSPGALSTGNKYDWKLEELQATFERLYGRLDELKNFPNIGKVSKEFGARGYAEYGREMFKEFLSFIGEEKHL